MTILQAGQTEVVSFVLLDSSDAEVIGLADTFSVQISKNGGAFAAGVGTKAEVGLGWYSYELTEDETDTPGPLVLVITGTGAVQQNIVHQVYPASYEFTGASIEIPSGPAPAGPVKYAQVFCSVADLADAQAPGVNEAGIYQRIREASDYLKKKLGWFIPVAMTRTLHGHGSKKLFVPPLLWITSIVDYNGGTLEAADYIALPGAGFWPNGPYSRLVVAPLASHLGAWADREDGVQIAGGWGKYNLSKNTGALIKDAGQQAAGATSLTVDNGAQISPGMVLLIEDEQELVTGWGSPIDSTADLDGAVAASDVEIKLTDASKVNVGEIMRVDFEQMKVLDRNTTSGKIYVKRGRNGTQAAAHASAAGVDVYRTATVERGMNGTADSAHLADTAISRYVVPDDVLFLIKENATLILNKAESGYQGRSGGTGTDQGVTFYNDAFPKQDIDRLVQAYSIPRIG